MEIRGINQTLNQPYKKISKIIHVQYNATNNNKIATKILLIISITNNFLSCRGFLMLYKKN